jgi:hypothetical protein
LPTATRDAAIRAFRSVEADLIEKSRASTVRPHPNPGATRRTGRAAAREDRVDIGAMRATVRARIRRAITYAFVSADLLKTWGLDAGAIAHHQIRCDRWP